MTAERHVQRGDARRVTYNDSKRCPSRAVGISVKQQIGQLLLEQRWVEPAALTRALAEQRHTGKRICSLLISRGQLDPDNAARALANQHNVPGVLQKHLTNRDPALAAALPAPIARACMALPIGRTRDNTLIVCVRDPKPEVIAAVAAAVRGATVIAVAPASQLEQLIKDAYQGAPTEPQADDDSFDVDLSTRQLSVVSDADIARAGGIPPGDPLANLGAFTLVGLDDIRVAKDPTQSGQPASTPRTMTAPFLPQAAQPATLPPRGAAQPVAPRPGTGQPAARPSGPSLLPVQPRIDATLTAIDRAASAGEASDAAMRYLAGRFSHAVLFAIEEGTALGDRGHGGALTPEVVHAITVPLGAPSILQTAHDSRQLAIAAPPGAGSVQDRLSRTLGSPRAPAAAPVEVGDRVAYVIAVGDATSDPDSAPRELEQLAGALGAALRRVPSPPGR